MTTTLHEAWRTRIAAPGKNFDTAEGVAVSADGSVIVVGYTYGELEAGGQRGQFDAWLAKYTPEGTQQWVRQIGSSGFDIAVGVETDAEGNIYVAGTTSGELVPGAHQGDNDAWLAKYSPDGQQVWIRQVGSRGLDVGFDVSVSADGSVYIAGSTSGKMETGDTGTEDTFHHFYNVDAWLARFSSDGAQQWVRQIGTFGTDEAFEVATDADGNVYLAGRTMGNLAAGTPKPDNDAWLAKYSPEGNRHWVAQVGTIAADYAYGLAIDSLGNIYIAGYTNGELAPGEAKGLADAWLAKYSPDGQQIWLRQLGSLSSDYAYGISPAPMGGVVVTGYTIGTFDGQQKQGGYDAWIAHYNAEGQQTWLHQFGEPTVKTRGTDVAVAADGAVYVSGTIEKETVPRDGFLAKFVSDAAATPTSSDAEMTAVVLEALRRSPDIQAIQADLAAIKAKLGL